MLFLPRRSVLFRDLLCKPSNSDDSSLAYENHGDNIMRNWSICIYLPHGQSVASFGLAEEHLHYEDGRRARSWSSNVELRSELCKSSATQNSKYDGPPLLMIGRDPIAKLCTNFIVSAIQL